MKKGLIAILILCLSVISFSKEIAENTVMIQQELMLDTVFKKLRESKDNVLFIKYNKEFKQKLKEVLSSKDAFTYPFDSLKSMSKITSPDGAFRIFNWNVEMENGVNNFYCFILKKKGTVIELKDKYRSIKNPELKSLTNKNWYGALYYKIIPMKRGRYTLLGWNGKDEITTQKIIETMSLGRKSVKFGFAIFNYPEEKKRIKKKRIILEYSNIAYVSLKFYQTKTKSEIVFSHLSPSTIQMKGYPQFYYPDLSYDKFVLKNNKWVYEPDIIIVNPKTKTDKLYNPPNSSDSK